jgi:hypothetical protein
MRYEAAPFDLSQRVMPWLLGSYLPAGLIARGRRQLSRQTFQLPETREVFLHLRQSLFSRQKSSLNLGEFSTTTRLAVAIFDPRKQTCQRCSRL